MGEKLDSKKRIYSLDALKAVAAFMVCYQHACGTGYFSEYILLLCKGAVPVFILITGFMYRDTVQYGNVKKQIVKFFMIAIEMELFWFLVDSIYHFLKHDISVYWGQFIDRKNIVDFVLFNDPIAADHGWYMWSVLYALIICALCPAIVKNRKIKWCVILGGNLFLLVCGKYASIILGHDVAYYITRNVWAEGLPFLLLGDAVRDWYEERRLPTNRTIWVVFSGACLLSILEMNLLIDSGVTGGRDSYIMTPFVAVLLFVGFLQMKEIGKKNLLVTIGMKYSLLIYIVHPLFVRVEKKLLPMNTLWQFVGVVVVFLLALLVAIAWTRLKKNIFRRIRLNQ